jgi:hypothetical protein
VHVPGGLLLEYSARCAAQNTGILDTRPCAFKPIPRSPLLLLGAHEAGLTRRVARFAGAPSPLLWAAVLGTAELFGEAPHTDSGSAASHHEP